MLLLNSKLPNNKMGLTKEQKEMQSDAIKENSVKVSLQTGLRNTLRFVFDEE